MRPPTAGEGQGSVPRSERLQWPHPYLSSQPGQRQRQAVDITTCSPAQLPTDRPATVLDLLQPPNSHPGWTEERGPVTTVHAHSSDLPGSRSPLRDAPIRFGATLTTCSPAASSACSSRREHERQSSIAHTRSSSSSRAHRTAARCPGSSALTWRLPRTFPVPSSTAASACDPLCVSAPITIMHTVP